jgi:mitochondrial import inner membrane translocase subunit TIM8
VDPSSRNTIYLQNLQRELGEFLQAQEAQAKVQSSVHNFTSMCWDK